MVEMTDDEIDAALKCGEDTLAFEPQILEVRYDRVKARMVVELSNGCTFLFPPRSLQGLEAASDDEIEAVEILGSGFGLHWETGGADYSIAGLLAGRFGTKAFMEARSRAVRAADRSEPARKTG